MRRGRIAAVLKALLPSAVTALVLLTAWWGVTALGNISPFVLPSPATVWATFLELSFGGGWLGHTLGYHIVRSLTRVLIAFGISVVVGIGVGLLIGWSRVGAAIVDPIFNFYRPLPPLAYYTLLIVWFGLGDVSKILVLILGTLPPIIIHTTGAVRGLREVWVQAALTLGANRKQLFKHVVVPGALPGIVTGVRVGVGIGFSGLVAAELVAAESGIGWVALTASTFVRTDVVLVAVVAMGLMAVALDLAVRLVGDRLTRWRIHG